MGTTFRRKSFCFNRLSPTTQRSVVEHLNLKTRLTYRCSNHEARSQVEAMGLFRKCYQTVNIILQSTQKFTLCLMSGNGEKELLIIQPKKHPLLSIGAGLFTNYLVRLTLIPLCSSQFCFDQDGEWWSILCRFVERTRIERLVVRSFQSYTTNQMDNVFWFLEAARERQIHDLIIHLRPATFLNEFPPNCRVDNLLLMAIPNANSCHVAAFLEELSEKAQAIARHVVISKKYLDEAGQAFILVYDEETETPARLVALREQVDSCEPLEYWVDVDIATVIVVGVMYLLAVTMQSLIVWKVDVWYVKSYFIVAALAFNLLRPIVCSLRTYALSTRRW